MVLVGATIATAHSYAAEQKQEIITYVGNLALLEQLLDKYQEFPSPQNKMALKELFPVSPKTPKTTIRNQKTKTERKN